QRHLGTDWERRGSEPGVWQGIEGIDDGELWETHQVLKARLLDFVRRRVDRQCERAGDSPARSALDLETLTISFPRRYATYKRSALLLTELERLAGLVNDPRRPIQLIFAGKAHPHDEPGKRLLRQVAQLTREGRFAGRVVFLEDYDINVGRHLV